LDIFVIQGGARLEGRVSTSGAKNSVLPILAASLLTGEPLSIENIPDLSDVRTMVKILEMLGARTERSGPGRLVISTDPSSSPVAAWDLVRTMRASFEVFGPLLARRGRAEVSYPGGCSIGVRPVDAHIRGFEALGARIRTQEGYVVAEAPPGGLRGGEAYLATSSGSSVGATRNVMMAAVLARGRSVLQCAACEPEVVDLARCLNAMGAKIEGAGSPTIEIEGVEALHGAHHRVIPDRIEAGTYLVAGAITGGTRPRRRLPARAPDRAARRVLPLGNRHRARPRLAGDPAAGCGAGAPPPDRRDHAALSGIPTDLQAQWMALMCLADGVSVITERIFPDRYMHLAELLRLGARIRRQETAAVVEGVPSLSGASIMASDLRASAALVLAGLVARGQTQVHRVYHIDRGYERIEERVARLGGTIHREALVGAQAG
jgi:UDP-N-acetylglucosamine 1-carboxyvinyltransferase